MSEADARRKRIEERIAVSQDRMRRESPSLPAVAKRENLPDAYPPEDYKSLLAEYPWLTVAAGLGLGVAASALLPKRAGSRVGRRALSLAALAAEVALTLSRQAGSTASERSAPLRQRAGRAAGSARSGMRSAGAMIAREAVRLADKARK